MKLDRNESVKYNFLRKRLVALEKQLANRTATVEAKRARDLEGLDKTVGEELKRVRAELAPLEEKKAAQ